MDFHTIIVILCLSLAFVAAVCLIWKATICEQLHLLEDSKCRRILTSFISRTNTYYNIVVVVGLKPIGNFALFCTKKGDKRALKARAAKPLWPSSSLSLQEALLQTDNCPFQKLFFIGKSEVKRSLKKKEGESIVDTELVKEWHDLYCDHKRAKECNWLLLLPFVLPKGGREICHKCHTYLSSQIQNIWMQGRRMEEEPKSSITHSYCCYCIVRKPGKCIRFSFWFWAAAFLSSRYVTCVWSNKRDAIQLSKWQFLATAE